MLFFFDWDGTLGGQNSVLSKENIDAIKSLKANKHRVFIATGRHPEEVAGFAKTLGAERYIIGGNGTLIFDTKTDEMVKIKQLDKKVISEVHNYAKKNGSLLGVMGKHSPFFFHYKNKGEILKRGTRTNNTAHYATDNDETKLYEGTTLIGLRVPEDELNARQKEFKDKLRDMATIHTSDRAYVQFVAPNNDKWTGIQWIVKKDGYQNEKIVCFGDSGNDLTMLKKATIGVAMGDATDEAKEAADVVIKSSKENGIALYIKEFLK